MILQGLYHLISQKRACATATAKEARKVDKDPRLAYEAGERADALAREADAMEEHAKSNEELMENLNKLLHYLVTSKHKSRYRALATTDIESAINWLYRENGNRTV